VPLSTAVGNDAPAPGDTMTHFDSVLARIAGATFLAVLATNLTAPRQAAAQNPRRNYSAGAQMGGQGSQLPFSATYRRPAVSAYNNISSFANNPLAAPNLYQQMVVPAQQQQQQQIEQMTVNRQLNKLQNQVQTIQRDTRGRQIDESIRPTGHRATYMNYSHYYGQ